MATIRIVIAAAVKKTDDALGDIDKCFAFCVDTGTSAGIEMVNLNGSTTSEDTIG
jgi:hypothetical protein